MSPTSQFFEIDVDGIVPPRHVSKLSRRNIRRFTMPPKAASKRRGAGSVTVGSNHPANMAAAKKKTDVARKTDVASRDAAAPTRESPKRNAKTVASDKIAALLSPHERVPVASVARGDDEIDATVVAPAPSLPPLPPPTWNAWYSSCCRVLCYVGDGGALVGECAVCGDGNPGRISTMLDPEQVEMLTATPGLSFDALMGFVVRPLPPSNPRGKVRLSPRKFDFPAVLEPKKTRNPKNSRNLFF